MMFVTTCKVNNSCTTYTVLNYEDDFDQTFKYQEKRKPLEWKRGVKVKHSFYGWGVIDQISHNQVTVCFKESKIYRRFKNIQVTFEFKSKPSEIDGLFLCC